MYEISLVPDVKAELLRKLRMRNLVYLICVVVVAACAGIFVILFGVTGGQGIKLAAQDTEIACRSDGTLKSGNCGSQYGTAVMKFKNAEELLTIQDQMKNLATLNNNKIKISRVFGILDVILPVGENHVWISELNVDIDNNTLSFDASAMASNGIGFRALEAFKKNVERSYYDYGNYMRYDKDTDEYVEIPSYCIDETMDKNGIVYGIYHKGAKGCEAPMVEKKTASGETTTEEDENSGDAELSVDGEDAEPETTETTVAKEDIKIRRTYLSESDMEHYRNGNDDLTKEAGIKGYYFESNCLKYTDGKLDEAATLEACPLLSDAPNIGDSSYGKNADGRLALSFSAALPMNREVFLSSNKHIRVIGPSRQNVTDSYIQIRDMFDEAPKEDIGE